MLAIIVPERSEDKVISGEKTQTYQVKDELKIGDSTYIISGNTKKKIKIIDKIWVSVNEMPAEIRRELIKTIPPDGYFNGAFKIIYAYEGQPEPRPKYEDADKIANMID